MPGIETTDSLINLERDLEAGKLKPVTEIVKTVTGRECSSVKVWRLRNVGCRGVKLSMVFDSGIWKSTIKAYAEFVRRQTAAAAPQSTEVALKAKRKKRSEKRAKRTDGKLREAGIL